MQVRTSAASAQANVTDDVATAYVLSRSDRKAGKVSETGDDAVTVLQNHRATVAAHEICEIDDAVRRCHHRLANHGSDVNPGVEGAFPIEWIDALSERSGDLTLDRPKIGSRISPQPIGGGRITRKPERKTGGGSAGQRRIP